MKTNNYFTAITSFLIAFGANTDETTKICNISLKDTPGYNTNSRKTLFEKEIITNEAAALE